MDGTQVALPASHSGSPLETRQFDSLLQTNLQPHEGVVVTVPLRQLVWARSGDKGDSANVGIIARHPEYFSFLREAVTAGRVAEYFAHLVRGDVRAYPLPGISAINFVMRHALDGGGTTSLRNDPLGKRFAQMLIDMPIQVPQEWATRPLY